MCSLKQHFPKIQIAITNLFTNCIEKMTESTSRRQESVYSTITTVLQSFPAGPSVSEGNTDFATHGSLDLGLKNPGLSTCIELQATFCHAYTWFWDRQDPSDVSVDLSFRGMYFCISRINH